MQRTRGKGNIWHTTQPATEHSLPNSAEQENTEVSFTVAQNKTKSFYCQAEQAVSENSPCPSLFLLSLLNPHLKPGLSQTILKVLDLKDVLDVKDGLSSKADLLQSTVP